MTPKQAQVLTALRNNWESTSTINDEKWGSVYLDNARPDGMSNRTFGAVLGSLAKAGVYKHMQDDRGGVFFGLVKL